MWCRWSLRIGLYSCAAIAILILAFGLTRYPSSAIFAQENSRLQKPTGAAPSRPHHSKPALAAKDSAETARIVESYGKLPLSFEMNQGQTDPRVKFLSRGAGYTFFLTGDEAVLALQGRSQKSEVRSQNRNSKLENRNSELETRNSPATMSLLPDLGKKVPLSLSFSSSIDNRQSAIDTSRVPAILSMKLLGANASAQASGLDELPGKSNYFIGNDPKRWRTNVPNYGKVRFADVYPGIDLVYYGNQRQLEYDWVVRPGADPRAVRFAINGADRIRVDKQGNLELQTASGAVRFLKPMVYQEERTRDSGIGNRDQGDARHSSLATRHSVDGRFVLLAKNKIGFEVGDYDRSKPLVIDPSLAYSTYLGGTGTDIGFGLAVDSSGNAYITGQTGSSTFPYSNGLPSPNNALRGTDVFVTKLNSTGTAITYSTFLGGSSSDQANGIVVDASGNAYITGYTVSADYPAVNAFQSAADAGACSVSPCSDDAVVSEISASGSSLIYSTFLGGTARDNAEAITIDNSATPKIFVTGFTFSTDFPTSAKAYQGSCSSCASSSRAFVTELDPSQAGAAQLVYSSFMGGTTAFQGDVGRGIALSGSGNIYITGSDLDSDFPTTTGAFQTSNAGSSDAFLAVFNPASNSGPNSLLYSTLLGGSTADEGNAVVVDSTGNALLTGYTTSGTGAATLFPTKNAFQGTYGGGSYDGFITKINPAGGGAADLIFSTFLGGSNLDWGNAIRLDSSGNIYVAGQTSSTDFPTASPILSLAGSAFVAKLDPTASGLIYSTRIGGTGGDIAYGLGLDGASPPNVYLAGRTVSTDFPTASPLQSSNGGGVDVFAAKISNLPQTTAKLSPSSFDFGTSTVVGTTSAAQTFTVQNLGVAAMTFSASNAFSVSTSADGQFSIVNNTCPVSPATLAGGASCTFDVDFAPYDGLLVSATLSVADDAGNAPQTAALTGTGNVTGPLVGFSGTAFSNGLTFTSQLVGTTSSAQTVTLTNTGIATLNILTQPKASGDFAVINNTCVATLAPSASCTFDVTFAPKVTGPDSGTVSMTSDAPFSPQSFAVSGTGYAPVPHIRLPLVPATVTPGSGALTLTVNGTGFVPGAAVMWNGSARTTTFVSSTKVTAAITAGDVAAEGTALVTVVNPATVSSASDAVFFEVTGFASVFPLNRTDYVGNLSPDAVVTGDFNGDKILDVAVGETGGCSGGLVIVCGPSSVSIFIGNGNGTFQYQNLNYPLPGLISGIAVGDFNGDHIQDLAVTDAYSSKVVILLGAGDGTFTVSGTTYATGTGPLGIVVGDFDGDGNLDIATADNNPTTSSVSILLGNGDGTFKTHVEYGTGVSPYALTVGDFNGDGKLDLAVANQGADSVSILLGNGNGTFGTKNDFASGPASTTQGPTAIGTGDFNGDGKLDLAVANTTAGTAGVLLGNGDGTFQTVSTYTTGPKPSSISIGDLDGDGILDVAIVNQNGVGTNNPVTLLTGAGNGTFGSSSGFSTGASPTASALGDFNRDGRMDLVTANAGDSTISALIQGPIAGANPSTIRFGNQVVGVASASQTVTVRNTGSANLAISSIGLNGTNPADFTLSAQTCPLVPQPGGCSATQGFYSGFGLGTFPFSSIFYISAPNGSGDRLVVGTPALGTAGFLTALANVPAPTATNQEFCDFVPLSPTVRVFAYVPTAAERLGDFSAFSGLLIDPTTGLAVSGGTLSPTSTFWAWRIPASAFRTGGLAPGASCTFGVSSKPTTTGALSALVTILNNATDGVQVNLSATGTVPVAILSPTSLTFTSQAIGTTSAGQTVTLTNGPGSTAALSITSIAVTGTNSGDYSIAPGTTPCVVPGVLAINASCNFVVSFAPTAGGARTAAVTIVDDAPGTPQSVPLTGAGTIPVPLIYNPLVPSTAAPGGGAFTLTVNGSGFVNGATVEWNGTARTTTFVSSSRLTAAIAAGDIAAAGTATIRVVNPGSAPPSNVVYFPVATPKASLTFYQNSFLAASDTAIVAADFNGDGIPDLVFTDVANGTLGAAIGKGNGTFTQLTPQTGFNGATMLTVGDFNGDGKLDVAVNNGSSITIALGNGDGTFTAQTPISVTDGNPKDVIAVDVNGDGKLDLVVATTGVGSFPVGAAGVLLGNGDGTFQTQVNYTIGSVSYFEGVAAGDFNRDGKLDLVVTDANNVTAVVFPGNGDGTFGTPTTLPLPAFGDPPVVAVADFNHDGLLDFAVNIRNANVIAVFLGNGDGTFQSPVTTPTLSGNLQTLVLGDYNNDGILDTADVGFAQLGNGDGTFQLPASSFALTAQATADFDGDGRLDIINAGINEYLQAPLAPKLSIVPPSLSFANQNVGSTSSAQTLTLTNNGSTVLQFTAAITATGDFAIASGTTCATFTVNIGSSCIINVTFAPTALGTRTGSISLSYNSPASPTSISLSGTGVSTAVASFSPTSLIFTSQLGSPSAAQTVTLTNTGSGALTISSLSITGTNPGDFSIPSNGCPASLPVSSFCVFTVVFTPQATGARSAAVTLSGNAAGTVPLSGTGTIPVPLVNQPLVPASVAPGGAGFTLTLNGTGFTPNSSVQWNGNPLTTTFVSSSQLTAAVPSSNIASPTTASLTVVNPAPGGGTSNVVFLPVTNSTTSVSIARSDVSVGSAPTSVELADLRGVGKLDAVVVNAKSDNISVLLGNGDGTFAAPVNYPVGSNPLQVAVRDFNGDGKPDLAVTNFFSNSISVLLGNGDGTFQAATPYNVGTNPTGIVAGDFNGDGNVDLAVANNCGSCTSFSVSILLGKGDGTFQPAVNYPVGGNTNVNLVTGDLNGDGALDLVVSTNDGAEALLGNGDGTFQPFTVALAGTVFAVDLADLNGDGKLDLVAADSTGVLNVALGNGDGTFQSPVGNTVGTNPHGLAIADLNGDGKLDLVSTNFGSAKVGVLLGNGNGTFQPGVDTDVGASPYFVTAGDFNGDGRLDLAVANSGPGSVSFLLQAPAITLSGPNFASNTLTMPTTPLNLTCTPRVLTITNTGSAALTIANIASSDNTLFAATTGTCLTAPLLPGANCQATVTFHPTATGTVTGTLTITSNAIGGPLVVDLSGTGQPACPLAAAATSQRILRGTNQTTFEIQPNVTCQATDQIALACVNANPATCAFNPGTIQNPQHSLMTMRGLNGITGNTLAFQVTGTSPDFIQRTLDLAVNISDFWFTPYPTSATISAGQSATYTVSVVPVNGLAGKVNLTCSGAPAGGSCTVSPSSIQTANDAPVQVQVQVQTSSGAVAPPVSGRRAPDMRLLILALGLAILSAIVAVSRRARKSEGQWNLGFRIPSPESQVPSLVPRLPTPDFRLPALITRLSGVALLLMIFTWASCGGGGTSSLGGRGTQTGRYSIVVTGTFTPSAGSGIVYDPNAPALSHNVTLTLNVQ